MSGNLRDSSAALGERLAAILIPELYASDPERTLRRLRAEAGPETETLARVCGQIAGFSTNEHTRVMCSAIIAKVPGAAEWAEQAHNVRAQVTKAGDLSGE